MGSEHFKDPFLSILPTIDLHGETSEIAVILVKDFITVNLKMNNNKIAIIHGRHSNIIKNAVREYLKRDKRVKKYYIYNMNDGVTIVEL